jgi:hypothetical protein
VRWLPLILHFAAAALVTAGCGTTRPAEPTAQEILDRAADEVDRVSSAHFSLVQRNGTLQLISGVRISDAHGDIQRPDRLQMKFVMLLGGGISAEEELIAMGHEHFVTNPFTGRWQASPSATAAPHFLDRERGVSSLLRTVGEPRKLPDEVLDEVQTLHVRGIVPTGAFAQMTDSTASVDVVRGQVWVGAADFLVRQLLLEGPIDLSDTDSAVRILKFSKFNQSVIVRRPAT